MNAIFRPASRQKSKLRMAIDGPAGSGKTFTALRFAFAIAGPGGRVAVINSESGAVEKYLGLSPDGQPFQFDVCELDDFAPTKYTEAILGAGRAGYDVLVIDSLSHAWAGSGGALEIKDKKSSGANANSFTAWKDVTPMHNQMIDAILRSPCHIIATMRSKTEYILETDSKGRSIPRKVGMAPIQRAGMEYEFDLYCSVDAEHILRVSKSRCPELDEAMSVKPGATFIMPIVSWLNDGSDAPAERFAVTEEDLRLLERRVEGEKPPAPPKSVAELMAEAAAKVEAQPAPAPAPAPVAELAAPAPAPAAQDQPGEVKGDSTALQRGQIEWLYQELKVSPEQQQAILAKRGLSVLRSLTSEQANQIIAALKSKLPAATTLVDNDSGQSHVGVHSAPTNGPCTEQQVIGLKQALIEWEQSQEGVTEQFLSAMNAAGFAKMKDLSFEQARTELANIEAKNIANFFAASLAPAVT